MVLIPAGEFPMGNELNEFTTGDMPYHVVGLNGFYMHQYEVIASQKQNMSAHSSDIKSKTWLDPKTDLTQF